MKKFFSGLVFAILLPLGCAMFTPKVNAGNPVTVNNFGTYIATMTKVWTPTPSPTGTISPTWTPGGTITGGYYPVNGTTMNNGDPFNPAYRGYVEWSPVTLTTSTGTTFGPWPADPFYPSSISNFVVKRQAGSEPAGVTIGGALLLISNDGVNFFPDSQDPPWNNANPTQIATPNRAIVGATDHRQYGFVLYTTPGVTATITPVVFNVITQP